MEMKHTPGPWVINYDEVCVRSDAYDKSFGMLVPIAAVMDDNQEANARLIAAAPDLLAALQHVYNNITSEGAHGVDMDIVHAAVAKALVGAA